jgi:putative oxygen-independent coproporphyrinogen III oxidase
MAYIDALLLDLQSQLCWVQGRALQSIFIGGGTPSLLSGAAVERLLSGIDERVNCERNIEVTLEANPGSAERTRFADYRRAGVNRLSIGVQSFDDAALRALGRIHSSHEAVKAVEAAQAAGFDRVNIDLMHGLPDQRTTVALADLQRALSFGVTHLSWYQLTIEANTAFYSSPPKLPAEDTLYEIFEQGLKIIEAAGLCRYEVSAYAAMGHTAKHNLNYWQFGDYLAIGAGAHGKVSVISEDAVYRFQRTRSPRDYLQPARHQSMPERETIDPADLAGECLLNGLRLVEGIPFELLQQRAVLDQETSDALASAVAEGLLQVSHGQIKASPLGYRFLDNLVGRLI